MISWIVSTGTVVVYVTTREILRSHQLLTFTTIIDWVLAFAWNGFEPALLLMFAGAIAYRLEKLFVSFRNIGTVGFVAAIICYTIGIQELVGKGVEYLEKATIGGVYGSLGGLGAILVYLLIPSRKDKRGRG